MALDPALVERFALNLAALAGPLTSDMRFALAVSGGPDSLGLLLLAQAALPERIHAATVDHGLRPEAHDEAVAVARVCAKLGVPHAILQVSVPTGGDGMQANARAARYRALGGWMAGSGLERLLTAHHMEDQAETLLLRLLRGSGVTGLAGVRARTPLPGGRGQVLRPLLTWRRADLAALVHAAGLTPADDSSNRDPAFDRARLRARLIDASWLDPEPLARSASHLAAADEALRWTADRLWEERARPETDGWSLMIGDLPSELVNRLLHRAIRETGGEPQPRGGELLRLAQGLAAGETRTLAGVFCRGGPVWRFLPAPPRREPPKPAVGPT